MLTVGSSSFDLCFSSSTRTIDGLPQQPSVTAVIWSCSVEYNQQNIVEVSQPSNCLTIYGDNHTVTSPITPLCVIECLTTSSSILTSISKQETSTVIRTTGMYASIIDII